MKQYGLHVKAILRPQFLKQPRWPPLTSLFVCLIVCLLVCLCVSSWTDNPLNMVNFYGFGRMSWNTSLTASCQTTV